jgi:DDE superfamily endonuclease
MLILPEQIMLLLKVFAPVFSERVFEWVKVLVVGAILAPHKRTVSAVLRVMGLSDEAQFQNYHRVLSRAVWDSLEVSKLLLGLLVMTFVGLGVPLVLGADETLERRNGQRILAKGLFRDAARSSQKHVVHSYGLRWVSMMLLVHIPFSERVWALPFLSVLATSQKADQKMGRRHKTSIDWIGQMIRVVRRWLPTRPLVLVVDGGLAAVRLGLHCAADRVGIIFVSRLRLDAALYDEPLPQPTGKRGKKPKKGPRQPSLASRLNSPTMGWETHQVAWYGGRQRVVEIATGCALWYRSGFDPLPIRWILVRDSLGKFPPAAFFATDQAASPLQILAWVIARWGIEVTFEEVRAHLGFESQRQWSPNAILRTSPALLGLFSFITLLAHHLSRSSPLPTRTAAWYRKAQPTFSDAIAYVRHYLWLNVNFPNSPAQPRLVAFPEPFVRGLMDTLCYAA